MTRKEDNNMYAVITGASSGIGMECAKILAKIGYDLILVARREQRLLHLGEKLERYYGIHVIAMPMDLAVPENCIELHERCRNYPVEVLINNAGFGDVGEFDETSLDKEINMINTNIKALHMLTKLFLKDMKKGYIMNVSSIAGFVPIPLMATYGASKAYVLSLTKAIHYEMKKKKKDVHVCALCPGPVDTEFDEVANVRYSLNHISAKDCAKAGIKGMFREKTIIFPLTSTKALSVITRLAPDCISLPVEYYLQNSKRNQK